MSARASFSRSIRSLIFGACAVTLAGVACAERVTGPGPARMLESMRPVYLLDGAPAPLPVGSVRIRLSNALGGPLLDTVVAFPADGSDLVLTVTVQAAAGTNEVRAGAEFLAVDGSVLFRAAPVSVRVVPAGQTTTNPPAPVQIPLTYVGPGAGTTLTLDATAPDSLAWTGDSLNLRAVVRDPQSQPVTNVPVVWASLDTTLGRVVSGVTGRVVMAERRGVARFVASTYTGVRDTVAIVVQPLPSRFVVVGGDTLRDSVATTGRVLRVRALGPDSAAVRNATLRFAPSGVTVDTTLARTDSLGEATVRVTLPQTAGTYGVQVTPVRGSGSTFATVLALPGRAAALTLVGTPPTSTRAGDTLPALTARVVDRFGNVVPTYADTVSAAVVDSAGVAIGVAVSRVPGAGEARFVELRPTTATTRAIIELRSRGLPTFKSTAFAVSPAGPSRLRLVSAPADSATAGTTLSPFVLKAYDSFGNYARSFSDTVRVALAGSETSATLLGTLNVKADTGVAIFNSVSLQLAGSGYRLTGIAGGLTSDTSAAFRIVPAAPSALVFATQPTDSVVAGDTLQPLTVEVRDAYGNVTLGKDSLRVSVISDSTGVTLGGTTARLDSAGRATFNRLSVTKAGTGYRLVTSLSTLKSDTSRTFAVKAASATQLVVTRSPTTERVAGDALDTLRVELRDSYGNRVLTAKDTVTLTLSTNSTSAAFYGGTKRALDAGVAVFTDVSVGLAGSGYAITAAASGVTSATTASFSVGAATARARRDVVSAGNAVCGLASIGTYCWGSGWTFHATAGTNAGSTIGDSTLTEGHGIPRAVLSEANFVSITAGIQTTCGLTSGGSAFCWGANGTGSTLDGRLGTGMSFNGGAPRQVTGGLTFKTISAGGSTGNAGGYVCGVTTSDQGYCWGRDNTGALGNGTIPTSSGITVSSPTQVVGGLSFATIRAGATHACGLTLGGSAYCWGANSTGQLGIGNTTATGTPTAVLGGLTFVDISAGPGVSCGLTQRGDAFCWGADSLGAVGDGVIGGGNRTVPTQVVGGHRFKRIAAGYESSCGITEAGAAYCWGSQDYLGSGSGGNTATPRLVSGGHTFTELAQVQGVVRCGVTTASNIYCWGSDFSKRLGNGFDGLNPTQVQNLTSAAQLGGGRNHTCALGADSTARCWGLNTEGQLGRGFISTTQEPFTTPQTVTGGVKFLRIESGAGPSTCGIAKADSVGYCWGANPGNGATSAVSSPTVVSGNHKWLKIAPGLAYTCGIATDSLAYCWGNEANGRAGQDSSSTGTSLPVPTRTQDDDVKWRDISAGVNTTCAIRADASERLMCWGSNANGALGWSTSIYTKTWFPIEVDSGYAYAAVAVGGSGGCGLRRTGGTVVCWGFAALTGTGQTGSGQQLPTAVTGISGTVVEIKAGNESFCARTSDGEAYCWGANYWGHLGNGNTRHGFSPVQVSGNHNFVELHLGFGIGCGRTTSGSVWCWGRDVFGNRGLGNSQIALTPSLVVGGQSFRTSPP